MLINAATFSASTSDIDPTEFMKGGNVRFLPSPLSPSDSKIINKGTISAPAVEWLP